MGVILIAVIFFAWQMPSASASSSANQLIIINKTENQLAFYENNKHVKTFHVATGRSASLTPEGSFKIVNKITNRPYYKDNIPGGHKDNPLGNRWLGLNANGTWGTTYAIHGNNNASSIGTYASAGCVRMHNDEVKWLYDKVKINTPVVIVSSNKSFNTIAKDNGYTLDGKKSAVPVNTTATLRRGSKGASVTELQKQLNKAGYNTKGVDGNFGPATEAAVKKFQKDKKLTSDGIVGTKTRNALFNQKSVSPAKPSPSSPAISQPTLRQGSRGAAVTELQKKLKSNGYKITSIDGVFGPETNSAIRKFQRDKKLTVDGVVGPKTWKAL
ncbi:N-acetylmuramoyl-L-alanine amidase [Salipaludibacillus keqinensis]|uniref:N-acetylmuramoyl-L-alanine amidase n=2 Tax=Salipaludibacillus keqinensis TaxID=2045207 RepID=A0A323TRZ8_9BACI|nr:N-acetylmuramoyl-L-alanine amidase [Salipaludibacillus keqinensis]